MTIFHSIILGIVEGFTEFLPISSTAHLILASELIGLSQTAFLKTFEIAIQSGAIFAVLAIYWRKFLDWEILKKIIIAFIPTGIIGFVLYKLAKEYLLGNISVVLWSLAIGGVILIVFEKYSLKKITKSALGDVGASQEGNSTGADIKGLSNIRIACIGAIQALAIIPGVSRSAATIIGGSLLGLNRNAVVEFSFLLAVPTILAATALDLIKNYQLFTSDQAINLSIGFVTSFITAIIGIKFLLSYVRTRSFAGFGVYRILIALLFLIIAFK